MVYVFEELKKMLLAFLELLKMPSANFDKEDAPLYQEIEQERIHTNYMRIIPSAFVLLIVELCALIINFVTKNNGAYSIVYIASFVLFLEISLSLLLWINRALARERISEQEKKRTYIIYWGLYTLNEMAFCTYELMNTGTTNHFLIFIITFSLWPILKPLVALPFYLGALTFEIITMYISKSWYFNYVFCIFITLIGIVASYIKYAVYISNSLNKKQLERTAEIDPLSGLLNRRGMHHALKGIWEDCRVREIPITVAMLDIDFFKMYNDTYGHAEGDECIRKLADCIRKGLKHHTGIGVRYGGEEFVVVLSEREGEEALSALLDLQSEVEEMKMRSGNPSYNEYVTVSMGVCRTRIHKDSKLENVLQVADDELYNAKRKGRNCLSYGGRTYTRVLQDK